MSTEAFVYRNEIEGLPFASAFLGAVADFDVVTLKKNCS
jgi:hypothetical protein